MDATTARVFPRESARTRSSERTLAVLMHLSVYGYTVFPVAFVIPLVIWLMKRDESGFLDDHGREALNFHISLVLYILISIPLILAFGLGILLLVLVLPAACLVLPILASVSASRSEFYRYPMCLRLIP